MNDQYVEVGFEPSRSERAKRSKKEQGTFKRFRNWISEPNSQYASSSSSVEYSGVSDEDDWRTKNFEDALQCAGFGRFQYMLALLCGWANASDAIEILSVSFILPSAGCDMGLTSSEKGVLSSMVFVGMMFGGYIWGYLADVKGRRQVLIFSLSFNATMAIVSSLCQSYGWFLFFRFLSGVGVGGSIPVVFSYFAEFQPKQHRGKMISVVAFFWMCGNIIAAGLAWIVIPQKEWGYTSSDPSQFQYPSWRIYITICTVPSLTSALFFIILPESPKFLVHKGQESKALNVLAMIFHFNKGAPKYLYPVKSILLDDYNIDPPSGYRQAWAPNGGRYSIKRLCLAVVFKIKQFTMATVDLFKPPLTRRSVLLLIQMFTLSFGYYGLWMWLPQLLDSMDKYGGSACNRPANATNSDGSDDCNPDGSSKIDDAVYQQSFITSLSNLPGNIFTILLVDWVGRKSLLSGSMILSGISVFFIYFLQTTTETLIMMCIFGGISVIGWNVLDILLTELYPTDKRSVAFGFMTLVGRVGSILANLAFGALIEDHCAIPILMVASFVSFGGILAIFLPNMQSKPLQ